MAERESGDDRGRNSGGSGSGGSGPGGSGPGGSGPGGSGPGGDDPISHDATDDRVIGGSGHDKVDLSRESVHGHTFSASGTQTVDRHGGRTTVYSNVGEIRFLDGRVVLDDGDPAAQVVRLYRAALGREADQGGLNAWTARLQGGGRLSDLAESFLNGPEFQARYGALNDTGFVDRLYQNVLGRAGDASGRVYWVDRLHQGTSRADVLASFSESAENKAATRGVVAAGIWDRSENAQQVARLYDTVFGRLPDASGLSYWRARLDDGSAKAQDVANAFTGSGEFAQRYGALSNRDFVEALYRNTLGRAGDATGAEFWTGRLDAGQSSRAGVTLAFSDSAEHQARTAPLFAASDPAHYGIALAG